MTDGAPALWLGEVTYRHRLPNWRRPWKKKFGHGIHLVNLELQPGSILGLIGPNGSGKTTLLHTIAGLHNHSHGDILIHGTSRQNLSWEEAQSHIGLMPERVNWSGSTTPREVLTRYSTMRGEEKGVEELLTLVGLKSRIDSPLDSMSQGMKQRLTLACALLGSPRILLLDEPMNGLDPVAQAAFRRLLRELAERGTAIIVSSHNLHEMELFVDSLAILHRGQMVASGSLYQVERSLGCSPSLVIAGTGWRPPSASSFGAGVTRKEDETWPGEDWRFSLRRQTGWNATERQKLVQSITDAGGKISTIQSVLPTLEEMLTAATGESAETVGLEISDGSIIPVKTWEVGEDE